MHIYILLHYMIVVACLRFKARLEEGRHQLQQMQAELRFAVQEKLAALQVRVCLLVSTLRRTYTGNCVAYVA